MGVDNLRSTDTVEVLLGISEGTIVGLEEEDKSFYLGTTALQNQSGGFNFQNYFIKEFLGTDPADDVVMRLGGISSADAVNVDLAQGIPVTRTTVHGDIDFIDLRFAVNRLLKTGGSGTVGETVEFSVEVKPTSSGTWSLVTGANLKISGQTSSLYIKEYRIGVTRLIADTWDIRVTKISTDTSGNIFHDITWESIQEITADIKSYPNTAMVQFSITASKQLPSLPQMSGIYLGRIIRIPSNYFPETRTYVDAWDGTFSIAWTDNPAWILYDFVMDDRFGIKSYYLDVNLDKFDCYDVGQWCDELVPDGSGGYQPRYTFNAWISDARSGKELARYIAGSFNATFFDDLNGTAYLRADRDDDAVMILTQEQVIDGIFDYTYTDITTRFNDITVSYINPDLDWNPDRRRVHDQDHIDKYGRIPLDFVAVGCTNTHEAVRRAYYRLVTATREYRLVNFRMHRAAQFLKPYDVILIADQDMGWGLSGRIRSQTDSTTLVLRDPVYLEVGVTYTIKLTLKDGTKHTSELVVGSPSGLATTLTLATPIDPNLVAEKSAFSIEAVDTIGAPRPFRVMTMEETTGDDYTIQCVAIDRNKWNESDNVTLEEEIVYSRPGSPLNPPGPLSVGFKDRYLPDTGQWELSVDPNFDRNAYKYYKLESGWFEVWSRETGSGTPFQKKDVLNDFAILDHPPGTYDFKILGISVFGLVTELDDATTFVHIVRSQEGDGLSAGASDAEAVGVTDVFSGGSASGSGSASAVAVSTTNAVGFSSGVGTVTAAGRAIIPAAGSSSGTSTVSAVGIAATTAVGSSSGAATAAAVGKTATSATGSSSGTSTVSAVGSSTARGAGSSSGTSTVAAVVSSNGILTSGDMQSGTDHEKLSGDMQSGSDVLQYS